MSIPEFLTHFGTETQSTLGSSVRWMNSGSVLEPHRQVCSQKARIFFLRILSHALATFSGWQRTISKMTANFLHVCPGTLTKHHTMPGFLSWNAIRLDINPTVAPDVIGIMTDMAVVATASVQAVFSSHNIEHLASKPARSEQEMMALMRGHQGVGAEL
jgi:hypothetical protein